MCTQNLFTMRFRALDFDSHMYPRNAHRSICIMEYIDISTCIFERKIHTWRHTVMHIMGGRWHDLWEQNHASESNVVTDSCSHKKTARRKQRGRIWMMMMPLMMPHIRSSSLHLPIRWQAGSSVTSSHILTLKSVKRRQNICVRQTKSSIHAWEFPGKNLNIYADYCLSMWATCGERKE